MKKIQLPSIILLLVLILSLNSNAQDIQVTSSEVYIRSQNTYGYLRYLPTGELLMDKSGVNNNNAFTINVKSGNVRAISVFNNWSNPYAFTVYGDGTAFLLSTAITSDSTLKKNIIKLDSQIENVKKLKGVSFNWKTETLKKEKQTYGLLAQDLEKVYPDMVFTNDSGVKAIFYDELIAVLIEAFKEQQVIIEELQTDMAVVKKQIGNLKSVSTFTNTDNQSANINELHQNVPNPFTENTRIDYYLSNNVTNAAICIYNLNGTQLKSIPLHLKGNGNVIVYGNELKAGIYLYSLIADGKAIDTKRMVLTD